MAEKTKDAEDRLLESMFAVDAIADDGFSERAVRRIRRSIWIRRLALPVATLIGAAIAIKPFMQLASAGSSLLGIMPQNLITLPAVPLPPLPVILMGGALVTMALLGIRMLEE